MVERSTVELADIEWSLVRFRVFGFFILLELPSRVRAEVQGLSQADHNRSCVYRQQHWSSGYDVRLTRGRSPVQSWDAVFFSFCGAVGVKIWAMGC